MGSNFSDDTYVTLDVGDTLTISLPPPSKKWKLHFQIDTYAEVIYQKEGESVVKDFCYSSGKGLPFEPSLQVRCTHTRFIQTYVNYIREINGSIQGTDQWISDTFRPQVVKDMSTSEGRVRVCESLLNPIRTRWDNLESYFDLAFTDGRLSQASITNLTYHLHSANVFLSAISSDGQDQNEVYNILRGYTSSFQEVIFDSLNKWRATEDQQTLDTVDPFRQCIEKVFEEGVYKEFPAHVLVEGQAPWDVHLLPCQMFVESARVKFSQWTKSTRPTRMELDRMIQCREQFLHHLKDTYRAVDPYRQLQTVIGDLKGFRDHLPKA